MFTDAEKLANLTGHGMESLSTFGPIGKDEIIAASEKQKMSDIILNKAAELDELAKKQEELVDQIGKSMEGLEIKPYGAYVMIQPFSINPFMGERRTESGLILTDGNGEYLSEETGEWEQLEREILTGQVIEVGPKVEYVKPGDIVYYTYQSTIPLPFFHQGYKLVNEGRVLAVVNDNLSSRK